MFACGALRDKLFLTIKEAARFAGLPQATIRRLIHAGKIPAVKAGGWRIKRSELEKLDLGPLTAARRWRRPRATLAPERFARFQRLSLALSYLVLARRPALALVSYSGLWFSLFPW